MACTFVIGVKANVLLVGEIEQVARHAAYKAAVCTGIPAFIQLPGNPGQSVTWLRKGYVATSHVITVKRGLDCP
eukprot:1076950-Pyramimonas_sp.AAC.1